MSWTRPSSDQTTNYEIVLYQDNTRACACPDFIYRRKDLGQRCKHLALLAKEIDSAWAAWQEARTGRPPPQRSTATPAQVERINRLLSREPTPPRPEPPKTPLLSGRPRRAIRLEDDP